MSYARFGWDGSDVYVFTSSEGIECCGCILQASEWVAEPASPLGGYLRPVGPVIETCFRSNAAMLAHLAGHTAAGHTVPADCIERLSDPDDAAANERIWRESDAEVSAERAGAAADAGPEDAP
jgi:hypothetical protein